MRGRDGSKGNTSNSRTRRPNKYAIDKKGLDEAMVTLKEGQQPPFVADCPAGCHHAVPYGSAEYCEDFKKKDLCMKQDTVKKCNMCRKCLKCTHTRKTMGRLRQSNVEGNHQ